MCRTSSSSFTLYLDPKRLVTAYDRIPNGVSANGNIANTVIPTVAAYL